MKTQCTRRMFVAAALSLSLASVTAKDIASESRQLVQPSRITAGQPFSFALTNTVSGEVIQVQTVSGEVVQSARADRYGRVFVPAGLAAGAYVISSAGRAHPARIDVQPGASAVPLTNGLRLDKLPPAVNLAEPVSMTGAGFSPNFADMDVRMGTTATPVLAATSGEMICAPPSEAPPGFTEITVSNEATGETAKSDRVLAYSMQTSLERRVLTGNEQTFLRVNLEPRDVPVEAKATVVSGPVNFGYGRKETLTTISNGSAAIPLHANAGGVGPFTVSVMVNRLWFDVPTPLPVTPRDWLREKIAHLKSATSENSNNKKALEDEIKRDEAYLNNPDNWDEDGDPKRPSEYKKFLEDEIERLKKLPVKSGLRDDTTPITDAMTAAAKGIAALPSPRKLLQKKADDCDKAAKDSNDKKNQANLKNESNLDAAEAGDNSKWHADGQPKDRKALVKFLKDEDERLDKADERERGLSKPGKGARKDIASARSRGREAALAVKK